MVWLGRKSIWYLVVYFDAKSSSSLLEQYFFAIHVLGNCRNDNISILFFLACRHMQRTSFLLRNSEGNWKNFLFFSSIFLPCHFFFSPYLMRGMLLFIRNFCMDVFLVIVVRWLDFGPCSRMGYKLGGGYFLEVALAWENSLIQTALGTFYTRKIQYIGVR